MTANESSLFQVSAEEKSKAMFSTGLDMEAGPGQSAGAAPGGSSVQDKLFVYQETEEDLLGPHIPDIGGLGEGGYLQHIKSVLLVSFLSITEVTSGPRPRLRGLAAMWRAWAVTGRCRKPWPASTLCRESHSQELDVRCIYTCLLLESFKPMPRSCFRPG